MTHQSPCIFQELLTILIEQNVDEKELSFLQEIKTDPKNSGESMSKLTTIFTLFLLLCFGLIYASRPNIQLDTTISTQGGVNNARLDDENCEGVNGRDECLMKKTLEAHVDYIYTQKPPPKSHP
ncbi:hypothetical protein VNO77_10538 [Canavalia gladiata]|uniref:Phytosulfokine n=1 Tax=Canavalia gladiata TaxID=3824 RepID=A0AAN9MAI3_CANGL